MSRRARVRVQSLVWIDCRRSRVVSAEASHPDAPRQGGLRDLLPTWHRLRYLAWRAGLLGKGPILVRLAQGGRLVLRPPPATDLQTAMEIFFCDAYRSPRPRPAERVRTIVDLGANVGYSIVYFSRAFPLATIEAFEPHPEHVRQIARHVVANGLEDRVTVRAAAAGTQDCRMFLLDAENRSTLVSRAGPGRYEVPVVDWLAEAAGKPIDFLKMDIEGSEYAILFDPRFARMDVASLAVEWHETPEHPAGGHEVAELLKRLGYQVERGLEGELMNLRFGLIWGYHA
jgi:FkbM family methyltransferase